MLPTHRTHPSITKTASRSDARASCVRVPTALYRHFDAAGRLLYVGISLNSVARLGQHLRTAAWFFDISRVEIEWFPARVDAEQAERAAILTERPLHNITHTRGMSLTLWELIKGHPLAHLVTSEGKLPAGFPPLSEEEVAGLADRL